MTLLFVYLLAFLFGIFSFKLFRKFYSDKKNRINLTRLNLLSLALIYGVTLIGMIVFAGAYPVFISPIALFCFGGLAFLVAYCVERPFPSKYQIWVDYLLCLMGTLLIVPDVTDLPLSFWVVFVMTSIFWLFGWHIIRFFDQYPFMTFIISSVWAVGLLLVGQIVSQIPSSLMMVTGLVGIMGFVCFRKRLSFLLTGFGIPSVALIGFFWSGVWAYFFLRGYYLPAASVYAYYLMELFVLVGCILLKRPMMPLFLKALQTKQMGGKAVRTLFWNTLLITMLSLFVMFFKNSALLFLTITIILILVYLVSQFKDLNQKTPGYRDVLSEMKKGVKELYTQTKQALDSKTLETSKPTPQKKKSVKTSKKKVVKGKKKK